MARGPYGGRYSPRGTRSSLGLTRSADRGLAAAPRRRSRPSRKRGPAPTARKLAALAVGGIVTYILIDIALRVLEPQYSLVHNAESDYGNGRFAWLMDLNFLVRCALSLAAVSAIGLVYRLSWWGRAGLALLTIWAIGSGLLAFFPDDLVGQPSSPSGRIHLGLALVSFVAVALGALSTSIAVAQDDRGLRVRRWLIGLAVAGLIALALVGRPPIRGDLGLFERLFLAIELGWLFVVSGWTYLTLSPFRRRSPQA
jgi:hypothetical membrane protein